MFAVAQEEAVDTFEALPPGTQLGRYQIVRVLGRGGMGAVYEGIHRDLKKRVAIKTLHPSVAAMPAARARFLREGEAASRINHPNVVDVTDVGTEGGITYLVMEFLEGEDLAAMLERLGALPIPAAVDIMLAICSAIAVAHDEGVIHRDLKPGNVFMSRTRHGGSKPVVLDFGISKLSAGGGNTMALTGSGAAMGTPYYVAPEQIRSAAGVDARSDQYALGAILYECVTGRRAHEGQSLYEVIRSVGDGAFPPPRVYRADVPPELEAAILRAMSLDPEQRLSSVRAFARAIAPFGSPAAREQWGPGAGNTTDADGRRGGSTLVAPTPIPFAGGTVVLPPTPDPSAASKPRPSTGGDRGPRTVPSPPDTDYGAAQITHPVTRRGPGLLIGGLVLLAGGAVAAYFLTAPDNRKLPRDSAGAASTSASTPAQAPILPRPYRVQVTASPKTARLVLDGREIGTGRIDEEIATDGTLHTLTVTADGYVPARFRFRDEPPPEQVTLEPVPAAPAAAAPAADASRTRTTTRSHERSRSRGGGSGSGTARASTSTSTPQTAGSSAAAPPSSGSGAPARGANNAAIIE
jgi:serine/threonine-protein kinase